MPDLHPEWGGVLRQPILNELFVWCADLPVFVNNTRNERAYVTSSSEPVTFPDTGQTFLPWPMAVGGREEDESGDIKGLSIALGNQSLLLSPFFERATDDDAPFGHVASLWLVRVSDPSQRSLVELEVDEIRSDVNTLSIEMRPRRFFDIQVPQDRILTRTCRWQFGGYECGYDTTAPGATFTTCQYSFSACQDHGDDEVANGRPRQHPRRFGGFPGAGKPASSV